MSEGTYYECDLPECDEILLISAKLRHKIIFTDLSFVQSFVISKGWGVAGDFHACPVHSAMLEKAYKQMIASQQRPKSITRADTP